MEHNKETTYQWFMARAQRDTPKHLPKSSTVETHQFKSTHGNAYRSTRSGVRKDIKIFVRSSWEADVIRILASYDIPYAYEAYRFVFPIKRGNKSYQPDILLPDPGTSVEDATGDYIEIKGFMDQASKTKLKRFKKYYPEEFARLSIIINRASKESVRICRELEIPQIFFFQDISSLFKETIANWESSL